MVSTMRRYPPQIIFSFLLLFCFPGGNGSSNAGEQKIRCIEVERQALLKIKEDLHEIKDGFLSSWVNEEGKRDCCKWYGVQCANNSGHVIVLDFTASTSDKDNGWRSLRGNISPSLRELMYLTYLDLSMINITGGIPSFIGTLTKLRYLNLSYNSLSGEIPPQLGNLSNLEVLDLGYNDDLSTKSMGWISHISSLRLLDLTYTEMSQATDWMQVVKKLPYLTNLHLGNTDLPNAISSSLSLVNSSTSLSILDLSNNMLTTCIDQSLFSFNQGLVHLDLSENLINCSNLPEAFFNMSTLEFLDLGYNEIGGFIPESLGNTTSLAHLNLCSNEFVGSIPEALGNLTALTHLYLDGNYLEGEFPKSLGNLCMLRELHAGNNNLSKLNLPENIPSLSRCTQYPLEVLDFCGNRIMGSFPNLSIFPSLKELSLCHNQFTGTIPKAIGELSRLHHFDIAGNSLNGVISESHFSNLSKLFHLSLSGNTLIFNISFDWIPPFQLDVINLASCKLGPGFPKWLQTQKNYSELDISYAGISDSIPDWFWDFSSNLVSVYLSNNQIYGTIPNSSFEFKNFPKIDLGSNKLEGSIPPFIFKAGALNLSTNRFSRLYSLCHVSTGSQLNFLDISFNQLTGDLPDCWSNFKELRVLVLDNNKLSGKIPISIGSLIEIKTLNLGNNYFTQELPTSLKSCKNLEAINVGENRLLGPIPTWIGESLSNLVFISLRSNHFFGSIPPHLCLLPHLQLLDLSSNKLSGILPKCLNNLTAMKRKEPINGFSSIFYSYSFNSETTRSEMNYADQVQLVWKGTLSKFRNTLGLVKYIDLSSNKLNGEIPTEITELIALVFLNLSRNSLSDRIPSNIGKLNLLDALDLSNNQLSGSIPTSLTEVSRLNVLDLSNNSLSGMIPTGTQLQSFEASSYTGNLDLCGAPLPNKCPGDEPTVSTAPTASDEEDQDTFITRGFYVTLGLGFVIGFWGVCGTLIFSKRWRYSYFNFLNDVNDWIYVMVAVKKAKLLRMITN